MRNRILIAVAAVAAALALGGLYVFVIAPGGGDTASAAVLDHVEDRADSRSAKVLTQQDWGDGELVLVGYEKRGVRRLGLAFAAEGFRGWKVSSYTEEAVEPDDVVVGSLLIASSEGSDGQPAWTAAVGELIDTRIARVEISWADGEPAIGPRTRDAYLVVHEGVTTAKQARFLGKEGQEITQPVPIEAD